MFVLQRDMLHDIARRYFAKQVQRRVTQEALRSFRKKVTEVELQKHNEQDGQEANKRENVRAVAPSEMLLAHVFVAAPKKVGRAKNLARPQPRRKVAVRRGFEVIGDAEQDERDGRAIDDGALGGGATAKPKWKNNGDGEPRCALEVVERLVSRRKRLGDSVQKRGCIESG
jgi:hypothetical protein